MARRRRARLLYGMDCDMAPASLVRLNVVPMVAAPVVQERNVVWPNDSEERQEKYTKQEEDVSVTNPT